MWAPQPIEIKLYSTDAAWLKKTAPAVEEKIQKIPGVVDTFNGLVYTGPTIGLRVRFSRRAEVRTDGRGHHRRRQHGHARPDGLLGARRRPCRSHPGQSRSQAHRRVAGLRDLPLRTPGGGLIKLAQVVDVVEEPGQLELRREDSRQDVAVTARLEGRDMGSAMKEIRETLDKDTSLPPGSIEYGGLYEQQQQSFKNLVMVLLMAIFLVFTVLLLEFGSFTEPLAIVFGAVLAMFGTILALWLTGTSLNVVSLLGAIIGIGIVAKNGILMLDFVKHLRARASSWPKRSSARAGAGCGPCS